MKAILRRKKAFWLAPVVLALLVGAFVFPLVTSLQKVEAAAPDDPLVGYGAGTTGGQGGPTVTVTTLSGLVSAVSGSSAKIVLISGVISGNQNVMVGSNTTILGVGASSGLKGLSLDLDAVSNVIIRNLTMSFVLAASTTGDEVHIIDGTNHVWIDHNELYDDLNHGKDYYDGQIDITRASDYITVSWNRLHDHFKSSLVGHSDTNGAQDTGHLHVTYHHNWFYNVGSRTPSLRFGTAHIYNNYFQNITDDAIHSRMGAQMLVENNVFRSVKTPLTTTGDSIQDGFANAVGNDYGGATPTITQVGTFTHAPYSYTLDPVSSVISEVTAYSGVGIISGSGGGSTPTPVPTVTSTPAPTSTPHPTATPRPTTTPQPTVTPQPTSTPTSGSSCKVSYVVQNQWSTGITVSMTITNTGSTTVNGWTLAFAFANGQTITQGWSGIFTQSGSRVSVKDAGYNGTLAPGSTANPGFNASLTGSNSNPTSFTLNGTQCSVV